MEIPPDRTEAVLLAVVGQVHCRSWEFASPGHARGNLPGICTDGAQVAASASLAGRCERTAVVLPGCSRPGKTIAEDVPERVRGAMYSRSIKFEEIGCNQIFDVAILTVIECFSVGSK